MKTRQRWGLWRRSTRTPRRTAAGRRWLSTSCAAVGVALLGAAFGGLLPSMNEAAAAEGDDFSGRWVLLQHTTTSASVPVVGGIRATTRVVSLHDLGHHGARLRGSGRLCHLELDSGSSMVETILPKALKKALPPPRIDARLLRKKGDLLFKQARQVIVVGAKLKRPEHDKMPTTAADPRIYDQDRDGHPGVTIRIAGIVSGEIYVAQRNWTQLSGRRVGPDAFRGRVYFGNEQHILGTTSSMLNDPPNARPVPSKSWFRLQRVANDATCAAANALAKGWGG